MHRRIVAGLPADSNNAESYFGASVIDATASSDLSSALTGITMSWWGMNRGATRRRSG